MIYWHGKPNFHYTSYWVAIRKEIPTSITIGILPLKETIEQAKYYLKKGFTIIKLKGGLNLPEDIEKIMKLREKHGNEFLLRYDANQGYTPRGIN